jgi:GTPase SAR1 family protein
MQQEVRSAPTLDRLAVAFEHSITWEDDVWRADPVDVELVHATARARFHELLDAIRKPGGAPVQARILLFHGQSGAGKTHLIRALRTRSHRDGAAYFGYAQMTPDVANYADYFLRRLINSLEKPYSPDDGPAGRSALTRLADMLLETAATIDAAAIQELRESDLDDAALAHLVVKLGDEIVAGRKFDGAEIDINIVRALLYLQRNDPRIDQRVRQYLYGRPLTDLAHGAVAALDPNVGEGRAFEIIEGLGRLMWTIERAPLVFSIDQVEDLRVFDDYQDRFQKAVRDLIQIANRLPTAIVIVSCLGAFYDKVRDYLAQSYVDRIEKAGPVPLLETRTAEEARLIIEKRLKHEAAIGGVKDFNPAHYFSSKFYEEFAGLSTRRILELAQTKCREGDVDPVTIPNGAAPAAPAEKSTFISALARALGGSLFAPMEEGAPQPAAVREGPVADFRPAWERFSTTEQPELPTADGDLDDARLMDVLVAGLNLASDEWGEAVDIRITRIDVGDDVQAIDLAVRHRTGFSADSRIFLSNRTTKGGSLKRQIDRILTAMGDRTCFFLRTSEFLTSGKNQTAQVFRKFRIDGGRSLPVPIVEWERMMTVREFHAHHRNDPGFKGWFEDAKLLSGLAVIIQLLRLDLFARTPNRTAERLATLTRPAAGTPVAIGAPPPIPDTSESASVILAREADATGAAGDAETPAWQHTLIAAASDDASVVDDDLPLSVILDEAGETSGSILAGRQLKSQKAVTLNKNVLKRHAAVLGGSGSGKTTLALSIIEQLLARGTPAVLIDRKGDLCSYANPDVWRALEHEYNERRGEREKLADQIDVAVYTPGRASGRPISITLLPTGINELPEHEQQLLANLSSAALGDMLHMKNSATHQKQSGILSVALKILGQRFSSEVALADLIQLLEDEDPELTDRTQRMDPSGKIRRDLVAQLDSLRHRNSSLFEAGGETLSMESLLGIGPHARPDGRTRLSIIYTGFLGDNENILFWVAQFLSEALRFCQRNPNDELQAVMMLDEADLYIPANAKPATAEPLQSLLKRARSAGLGIMLATQSPGDLDYKSRDQITSWFIGRVREDTALRKLKAAFQSESGLDPAAVLPHQTVGEFHLVQEGIVRPMKAHRSLINAEQVPFDKIEQLARETRGQDEKQLRLFG